MNPLLIFTITLTMFALTTSGGHTQPYDDPAVAVCEFSHTLGADIAADGFKRVSANIDGASVILTYERSILNTKPKRTTIHCQFEALPGNRFGLTVPVTSKERACIRIVKRGRVRMKQLGTAARDYPSVKAKVEACETIANPALVQGMAIKLVETQLAKLGIYPISAADTDLRAGAADIDRDWHAQTCADALEDLSDYTEGMEPKDELVGVITGCLEGGLVTREQVDAVSAQ